MKRNSILRAVVVVILGPATICGGLVSTQAPASAKTISACVNNQSGEMKLAKKKCKKGWKKVTWNIDGPQGAQGPQGPSGVGTPKKTVRDKSGNVVGSFLGMRWAGAYPEIWVERDGGWWTYSTVDGTLLATMGEVLYDNDQCEGATYSLTSAGNLGYALGSVGTFEAAVERVAFPLKPARAFRLTQSATAITVDTTFYALDWVGFCHTWYFAKPGDYKIAYREVPAPPDHPGPLTIG